MVRALFAEVPPRIGGPYALEPARAAVFGSGWREAQRATQVGPLWILPPERRPPAGARAVVRVDALKAFGAGTHDTTVMCLERVVERSPVREMLDVGTGSGVLALAALRLGAARALGLDVEAIALEEARKNAHHNGLQDRLELSLAWPDAIERRFPLVLANVRTPALIGLVDRLIAACAPDGELVLSGIRTEEVAEVLPVYLSRGLRVRHQAVRGDWVRLDLDRGAE